MFYYSKTTTQNSIERKKYNDGSIKLTMKLPGYNRNKIRLFYLKNNFLVTTKYRLGKETEKVVQYEEANVDTDSIKANMEDGILELKYKLVENEDVIEIKIGGNVEYRENN